jgi:DNA repair protein RadC
VAAQEAGQLSVLAALIQPYAAGDAHDIARRLIARFGSLRTIYSASVEALCDATGAGPRAGSKVAAAIVGARRLAEAATREVLLGQATDTNTLAFRQYLVSRLGSRREECVMLLFFTGERLYIAEDLYVGGKRAEIRIPLRRTVRRAFDLDARRIVVAHNHPSGVPQPSASDIAATTRLCAVLEALEITLDDHCVVSGNSVVSMRAMRLV